MALQGEIVPRPDANPGQLKALASAIQAWFAAYLKDVKAVDPDLDGWIDESALDDLRAGELPQPFLLRLVMDQPGLTSQDIQATLQRIRSVYSLAHRTIPPANARWVSFGVSLAGTSQERDHLLEMLRCFVPAEYVARIIVNGAIAG